MPNAIEVRGLVKKYGDVLAVDDVSFDVKEGTLFAFLGPNGAGKTSTINCICTTAAVTSGTVTVAGHDVAREPERVRASIGVVFQESVLDNKLTVAENLLTRGSLYGLSARELGARMHEAAESVSVADLLRRRYGNLSGGQRRRVDMARGLIHRPRILFLDEPTTGLDPQTRLKVWETVARLQKTTGMTVFMTTHYMEEAAGADQVAIIDRGRIAARGTPEELRKKYSADYLRLEPKDAAALAARLAGLGIEYRTDRGLFVIRQASSLAALGLLQRVEPDVAAFEVVRGNMDDVFMAVTGHDIRGEGN
jgi:multidrug/hemolysin transport system ATP-binding protein